MEASSAMHAVAYKVHATYDGGSVPNEPQPLLLSFPMNHKMVH